MADRDIPVTVVRCFDGPEETDEPILVTAELMYCADTHNADESLYEITAVAAHFTLVIEWVKAKDLESAMLNAATYMRALIKGKEVDDPLPVDEASVSEVQAVLAVVLTVASEDCTVLSAYDGGVQVAWYVDDWRVSVTVEAGEPTYLFAINPKIDYSMRRPVQRGKDLLTSLSSFQSSLSVASAA